MLWRKNCCMCSMHPCKPIVQALPCQHQGGLSAPLATITIKIGCACVPRVHMSWAWTQNPVFTHFMDTCFVIFKSLMFDPFWLRIEKLVRSQKGFYFFPHPQQQHDGQLLAVLETMQLCSRPEAHFCIHTQKPFQADFRRTSQSYP